MSTEETLDGSSFPNSHAIDGVNRDEVFYIQPAAHLMKAAFEARGDLTRQDVARMELLEAVQGHAGAPLLCIALYKAGRNGGCDELTRCAQRQGGVPA